MKGGLCRALFSLCPLLVVGIISPRLVRAPVAPRLLLIDDEQGSAQTSLE